MDWMIPVQAALVLLPWAWGTVFLGWCLAPANGQRYSMALIALGAGAYLGYMVMAGVLYFANRWQFPVFGTYVAFALITGALLTVAAWKPWFGALRQALPQAKPAPLSPLESGATIVIATLAVCAVAFAALENYLRPAETWDALQHWALESTAFLRHHTVGESIDGAYRFTKTSHWPTVKLISAWSGWAASHTVAQNAVYAPWVLLQAGLALAAAGIGLCLTARPLLAALAAYLVSATPMITVHTALGGYADLWQAAGVFIFMALVLAAPGTRFIPRLLACCFLAMTAILFTKGNGAVYVGILLAALAAGYVLAKTRWAISVPLLVALTGVVIWLFNHGVDVSLGGYRIALLPSDNLVALGERTSGIPGSNWAAVWENTQEAWGYSASFNGALPLIAVAIVILTAAQRLELGFAHFFSLCVPFAVAIFLILAQRYSEYFFEFSTPAKDTGFSRFSMVLYLSALPALLVFLGSSLAGSAADKAR